MAKRQQIKISDPYTLRMRTFDKLGQPGEWFNQGTAQFIGMDQVQRQIKILKANKPNRDIEIEFKYKDQLRDFTGEVIGKPILYKSRTR